MLKIGGVTHLRPTAVFSYHPTFQLLLRIFGVALPLSKIESRTDLIDCHLVSSGIKHLATVHTSQINISLDKEVPA